MPNQRIALYEIEDRDSIDRMLEYSTVAFEGLNLNQKNLDAIIDILDKQHCTSTRKDGRIELFAIAGTTMNKCYNLKGDNAYIDDFPILCICPQNLENFALASNILRGMGARWLKDIIRTNDARNER